MKTYDKEYDMDFILRNYLLQGNTVEELTSKIFGIKFIWGIKSASEETEGPASFYTQNDLNLCFDSKTKIYFLDIDLPACSSIQDQVLLLSSLRDDFANYLKSIDVDTTEILDIIYKPVTLSLQSDSLAQLYAQFNILVEGFKTVNDKA